MRKVFLDDLPRKKGYKDNRIDWYSSVGHKVKFIYDDIEGEIEIVESDNPCIKIKYNNDFYNIKTYNFISCGLRSIIGKKTKDFKVKVGSIFKDDKRDLIIIDKENRDKLRINSVERQKWYKYKCNKCGWNEGWIEESNLLSNNNGCACCHGRVVVEGINDINTTAPWLKKLGLSEADAKMYTKSSRRKVFFTCPICNELNFKYLNDVYNLKSIGCKKCRDGISYSEKFMYSLLKQLNVKFETQYSPDYIKPKRSDFYLSDYKLVIETDGNLGHKGGNIHPKTKLTLEKLIEIDKWKDEQHLKHGIKTIRINCFKSEMDYIKSNVLNSELNDLFDLSKINWLKCEGDSLRNMVKEVCDYWNNKEDWETTTTLSNVFSLDGTTVRKYLKLGTRLSLCFYDVNIEEKKRKEITAKRNKERCSKMIEIFKDNVSLGVFESIAELSRQSESLFGIKFYTSNITKSCIMNKEYKGYTFKYLE